ncbi:Ribosomal protein S3AE [Methanonatronarchaeum thermophilum]|uniref:Small ribosomal subunit protein eS1 n=1 Tax=Methanonatronarchaeum thermophilum TaxID=1927129 RepID=A0A1Y3GB42_9EURY|nr:30S ribosomal protein S3ae [Methanonatronarchaeum thermophilum]OUJ18629.1 Ribosomal protein S3AE [Methanonatronarchaeum thermophilum]
MSKRKSRKFGWEAKDWYTVMAPEIFGEDKIGETPADEPSKVTGRVIETTVGDLTGDFSKNNVKLYFKINKVSGNEAYTQFIGHELTSDYIGSLIRRRTDKIDLTVDVLTQDGYKIRVKPILFTVKRGKSSQKKGLRKKATEVIKTKAKTMEYQQFTQELVTGQIASEIYQTVKSIYPLRRVEIRKSEVTAQPDEIEEIPEGFEETAEEAGIDIEKTEPEETEPEETEPEETEPEK